MDISYYWETQFWSQLKCCHSQDWCYLHVCYSQVSLCLCICTPKMDTKPRARSTAFQENELSEVLAGVHVFLFFSLIIARMVKSASCFLVQEDNCSVVVCLLHDLVCCYLLYKVTMMCIKFCNCMSCKDSFASAMYDAQFLLALSPPTTPKRSPFLHAYPQPQWLSQTQPSPHPSKYFIQ
jgi:hypothetical protein